MLGEGARWDARRDELLRVDIDAGQVFRDRVEGDGLLAPVATYQLSGKVGAVAPIEGDAGWLLAYGLLSHGLGMILIASSLPQVTTTDAGIALLLQPTLSYLWEMLFFDRPFTLVQFAGAGVTLFAIWLGARSRATSNQV